MRKLPAIYLQKIMKSLLTSNINSARFWDTQYSPRRRKGYIESNEKYIKYDYVLETIKDEEKILDMGCGLGIMGVKIKEKYPLCDVWAFDFSSVVIDYLRVDPLYIHFLDAKIGEEDVPDDFDVVTCLDVIEHMDDATVAFKDAFKHLKVGGRLIVTTPDGDTRPYAASPEHMWLFDHEDIDKFYTDAGFEKPEYLYLPGREGVLFITAVGKKL